MQSSSDLFPVALISAEFCGDLSEDIYRLKPANSPDMSVELAVTRLGLASAVHEYGQASKRGVPVILVHGSFANRRFWYSARAFGLGAYLARAGYDVWIAEMRGHGVSQRNEDWRNNRVVDYARYDLPAVGAFVAEQSGQTPHWLGHSLGGVSLAAALGGGYLDPQRVASLALFASQVTRRFWPLRIPAMGFLARLFLRCCGSVSGPRLKRGPEDEPLGVATDLLRWHAPNGRFGVGKEDWWAGLNAVRTPLLAAAGALDEHDPVAECRELFDQFGSPTKRFMVLGRNGGMRGDYGHVDMLAGKSAEAEVWPVIQTWLRECSHVPTAQVASVSG